VADSERDGNDEQHRDPADISFEYPEPRAEELVPGADRRTGRPDSGRQGFWPPGQIAGSDRRVHGGQAAIDVQRDAGDIGRVASAQERVSRRLVSLVVSDPEAYAWGGERYDATVSLQPPYDPSGARIRAL
jgi:hypothetical protein